MIARGVIVKTNNINGKPKAPTTAPEFGIACKMLDKLNQIGMQFGLSPAARDRLNLGPAEPEEQNAEFFGFRPPSAG
jgi:P27 family predicted phage terminase small subunit